MSYDHLCPENLCYILQGKKNLQKKIFFFVLFCKIPDDKCALLLGHQLLRDISLLERVFKYLIRESTQSALKKIYVYYMYFFKLLFECNSPMICTVEIFKYIENYSRGKNATQFTLYFTVIPTVMV